MIWLLLAVGLSALFAWIATWISRRPHSLNHGIREFSKGLEALAPPDDRGGHVRYVGDAGGLGDVGDAGDLGDAVDVGDAGDLGDVGDAPPETGGGR